MNEFHRLASPQCLSVIQLTGHSRRSYEMQDKSDIAHYGRSRAALTLRTNSCGLYGLGTKESIPYCFCLRSIERSICPLVNMTFKSGFSSFRRVHKTKPSTLAKSTSENTKWISSPRSAKSSSASWLPLASKTLYPLKAKS